MEKNKIIFHYRIDDKSKLNKPRLRYIIYGGIILSLAILLFILLYACNLKITLVLDYFVSVSLVSDMILGILYIIKGILLKDNIKSESLFNLVNARIEDGNIKTYMGLIKYLSIIPLFFNVSVLVFYITTLAYNTNDISFVMIFSLVISIILSISAVMSFISIDSEHHIYDKVE